MGCKLVLSDGPHGMQGQCLEFYGISRELHNLICAVLGNKYMDSMDSEDYKNCSRASPFFQCDTYRDGPGPLGEEDDPKSYFLVEFWSSDEPVRRAVRHLERQIDESGIVFSPGVQVRPKR